jgi:DNA repair exonuclease SbcCD ATPase subunit
MKIVRLSAENIKRLTAVEISPEGTLVTITGKNGAGKSSVLDSIAYALGGKELVPAEPIRRGELSARVTVDLGEFVVTRTFKRDVPDGPTKSTLVVKTKDGASYASPQKMLDQLLGQLTFDPMAFAQSSAKEQSDTLRQLVGLDFSDLDEVRQKLYNERTNVNRVVQDKKALFESLKHYDGVPAEEISMTEVSIEMQKAEQARVAAQQAQREVDRLDSDLKMLATEKATMQARFDELSRELNKLSKRLDEQNSAMADLAKTLETKTEAAKKLAEAVPDASAIQARISEIEDVNQKVRANIARAKVLSALTVATKRSQELTDELKQVDVIKAERLSSVKFPIDGLSFGEHGILFNGVPFEQASTAERLKVSVAIGLALNPKLKVLLVRDGSNLDSDNLKLLASMAEQADAQVWLERVAESKDGVGILIEDGHLA